MPSNILSIDSGGTSLKALIFDETGHIIAREVEKTPAIQNEPGQTEHDPEMLWQALLAASERLLASIDPSTIAAMGICNQRGSFLLWEKATGKPLCNFISWADVRAARTCDEMNASPKWHQLKAGAKLVSKLTGNTMMTATSLLNFTTDYATVRLKWLLDTTPGLRDRCKAGEVLFGTLDTWFIYKLTGGAAHLTDYTNAGATGLFNPFQLKWNDIFMKTFDIEASMFPDVKETNGDFGVTNPDAFLGQAIPIRAAAGDQMAAMFGQRCFEPGLVKISQGSGAFVDLNVGEKPKLSKRGLFPLIAWRINGKPCYMLEGFVATAGTLIDWLGEGIGLSDTPTQLNELAAQCEDTEGVFFVPTNSGMRFPHFNPDARGCIFGLSLSTHRRHVARAVLEGLALSLVDVIDGMEADTKVKIGDIRVDGGVSKSDILLQALANFSGKNVSRAPEADMTATGVAYLAGLGAGVWKDLADLRNLDQGYQYFQPQIDAASRGKKVAEWRKAVNAVLGMYQ
jgi:glycerol kinase